MRAYTSLPLEAIVASFIGGALWVAIMKAALMSVYIDALGALPAGSSAFIVARIFGIVSIAALYGIVFVIWLMTYRQIRTWWVGIGANRWT